VIRIADEVVAEWGIIAWKQNGKIVEQVEAYLFNGLIIIMDLEDFFSISDDDS